MRREFTWARSPSRAGQGRVGLGYCCGTIGRRVCTQYVWEDLTVGRIDGELNAFRLHSAADVDCFESTALYLAAVNTIQCAFTLCTSVQRLKRTTVNARIHCSYRFRALKAVVGLNTASLLLP